MDDSRSDFLRSSGHDGCLAWDGHGSVPLKRLVTKILSSSGSEIRIQYDAVSCLPGFEVSERLVDLAALSEILGSVPNAKTERFAGDLATPQAAELLGTKFPSVDILVNNLGIFEPKPFEQIRLVRRLWVQRYDEFFH